VRGVQAANALSVNGVRRATKWDAGTG